MLAIYFTVDETGRTTTYSQREKMRKDKILQYTAPVKKWLEKGHLEYLNNQPLITQVQYMVERFMHSYPLDGVGARVFENRDDGRQYYSFRNTLDDISEEEQKEVEDILLLGVQLVIEHLLEHHPRTALCGTNIAPASDNCARWWSRLYSRFYYLLREGYFKGMSEGNLRMVHLAMSLIYATIGRGNKNTDIPAKYIEYTYKALELIRYEIDNYSYYIKKSGHNVEYERDKFNFPMERVKALQDERAADLIPIEAEERAEAKRWQEEIEEQRRAHEAARRLYEARLEAYDRACDRAGGALPWMY